MTIKGAGVYEIANGEDVVTVKRLGRGWIAAANWDRHLYTDIVPTKREAVEQARYMFRGFDQ